MTGAATIRGIVETCINVSDMNRARRFYESTLGLEPMKYDDRFCAFQVGAEVLLLFTQGASDKAVTVDHGVIPPHNTIGAGHFALSVSKDELEAWRSRIGEQGIAIESEVLWERGGRSIYFRDPDNNLVELATPGIWPNY